MVIWAQSPTKGEKTHPREPSTLLVAPEQHQGMADGQVLFFLCLQGFGASLHKRSSPIAPVGFESGLQQQREDALAAPSRVFLLQALI